MNRIIALVLLLISINIHNKNAMAQPVNLPEASDSDNSILDIDGKKWSIIRVLEKNIKNNPLAVTVTFEISSTKQIEFTDNDYVEFDNDYSFDTNYVAFDIDFFTEKYRNKKCVLDHKKDENDLIKIVLNDSEEIIPAEQDFEYLDADYDQGEYMHHDSFTSVVHISKIKRMANAKTLKYQVCGDTYQLSPSAIKELKYFVSKIEEAAKKYNHNLE